MERNGPLGRLQGLLTDLIGALCRDDVTAIEEATLALQRFLESEEWKGESVNPEALALVCRLLEAAQCLVWTRLLSLAAQGNPNPLVTERV
jgi:hypothetical protein